MPFRVSASLFVLLFLLVIGAPFSAQQESGADGELPDAEAILARIDENMVFDTRTATMTMRVEGKRRTRVYTMQTYGRGEEDSAIEYLDPPRDKGTRMLKLGDQLWLYLPTVERTQKISGHMMRQGMMGSDLSYEDMMASRDLRSRYDARVVGTTEHEGRPCWRLEMIANDESVAYPKRVSLIDRELGIPVEQELYALSGLLLKTWRMGEIREFEGGRWFPTRMEVVDHLKTGSRTILEFESLEFGVDLEGEVFSMRWLERR